MAIEELKLRYRNNEAYLNVSYLPLSYKMMMELNLCICNLVERHKFRKLSKKRRYFSKRKQFCFRLQRDCLELLYYKQSEML